MFFEDKQSKITIRYSCLLLPLPSQIFSCLFFIIQTINCFATINKIRLSFNQAASLLISKVATLIRKALFFRILFLFAFPSIVLNPLSFYSISDFLFALMDSSMHQSAESHLSVHDDNGRAVMVPLLKLDHYHH